MKNNETGEFELVMGNRQLLSGFFIVALLFGVAFAMGYIVGRNSSPSARAVSEMQTPAQAPVVSDARPTAGGAPPPPVEPPRTDSAKTGQQTPPDPLVTQPAKQPPTETRTAAPEPAAIPREPGLGNYWQVMAVKQPEAEVVVKTLKDKGFPASLEPGPNNLTRVLVGPYTDRDSLGKAKADLENAGFHPMLKKDR
jgi:cell division septation protein DedD